MPSSAALGHRRHRVVLVVEGEVVEDVLAVRAVHAPMPSRDHRRQLVRECRVVGAHVRDRAEAAAAVPVLVLQALAVERGAPGGAAEQEAATARVAEGPDQVADALEAEHRVVDVERDHRPGPGRVRGAGGGEARHRARLGDALLEDLAVAASRYEQQHPGVDRLVALPERGVDLDLAEQRVHAERARLVGDDRNDAVADRRVAQQVAQQPANAIVVETPGARAAAGENSAYVRRSPGSSSGFAAHDPTRQRCRQARGGAQQVLVLGGVRAGVVVGRLASASRLSLIGQLEAGRGTRASSASSIFLIWCVALRASIPAPSVHPLTVLREDDGRRSARARPRSCRRSTACGSRARRGGRWRRSSSERCSTSLRSRGSGPKKCSRM